MSLERDIQTFVESVGLALYDATLTSESGETIYRVSVQDPKNSGGVTMDKCVELTHLISPLLDVNPPVSGEYRLEVGSPGIERKLAKLEHFQNSLGENIAVTTLNKEKFRGTLREVKEKILYFDVDGEEVALPFDDVVKARTYYQW
jgi:ribosome maturation factor RimP